MIVSAAIHFRQNAYIRGFAVRESPLRVDFGDTNDLAKPRDERMHCVKAHP